MAHKTKKRKHHKVGTRRRRHRMGAVHPALKQTGMMLVGAGLGAIAGTFVNQTVKSSFPTMPGYMGGAVSVIGGAALIMLAPPTPLMTGIGAGLMGIGAVYATNETFLSLPGISGMPVGVPSAAPGYLRSTVGSYRGIPLNRIGNLSGGGSQTVGAIYRN